MVVVIFFVVEPVPVVLPVEPCSEGFSCCSLLSALVVDVEDVCVVDEVELVKRSNILVVDGFVVDSFVVDAVVAVVTVVVEDSFVGSTACSGAYFVLAVVVAADEEIVGAFSSTPDTSAALEKEITILNDKITTRTASQESFRLFIPLPPK